MALAVVLDKGFGKTEPADKGTGGTQVKQDTDQQSVPAGVVYGGGGGGGGGRGGGGGGGGDTTNDQIQNLGDISSDRKKDITKNTKGRMRDFKGIIKGRAKEMSEIGADQLKNIQKQRTANNKALEQNRRNIMKSVQWQPNQQKEQSMLMALRNRMGNAAYGSGIQDLLEGMQRIDDMNDVELIDAWRQNENNAYENWRQAEQGLIADYDDQVASILDEFSQFNADSNDNLSKMKWDYNDEISSGYAQYATSLSNIDPLLASRNNIRKAAKNANGTSKESAELTKAKNVAKAISLLTKPTKKGSKKKAKKTDPTKGLSSEEKHAYNEIRRAANDKGKNNAKAFAKAANKAAKAAVKKAEKASKVTANGLTLPNVDMRTPAKLNSKINVKPSNELQKLLVYQKNAPEENPNTIGWIRPDQAQYIGGTLNTSRQANSGFSDNLAAFRRV